MFKRINPFETLVHDEVSVTFNRDSLRTVSIKMNNCSIEEVYERAINLGYKPIKWFQFWRKPLGFVFIHNKQIGNFKK